MALRPKGHSCLSSRLLFSRTICKNRLPHILRRAADVLASEKISSFTYPDIGVLMKFGQVKHVVQCQHPRRSLCKIHGWIDVILWKMCRKNPNKLAQRNCVSSFSELILNHLSIRHSLTSIQELTLNICWQCYLNFLEERLIPRFFIAHVHMVRKYLQRMSNEPLHLTHQQVHNGLPQECECNWISKFRYQSKVKVTAISVHFFLHNSHGDCLDCLHKVYSLDAYSESQHLVVLGVHGFAFLCSTARDGVAVRLCIKCNSSQLKYDVSLCLKDRRQGNGDMSNHYSSIFT